MLTQLLIIISVLAPILTALTAAFKQYIPEKYQALIPVILGVVLGPLSIPLVAGTFTLGQLLWAGLLSGLTAGGFYSVQNIRKK